MATARFEPAESLEGTLTPPPDKSISHRAALIGAIGDGRVTVRDYLDSADTRSTLDAIGKLGAGVERTEREGALDVVIDGIGLSGARGSSGRIDVGNAGTLIRLLSGWLAAQEGASWELNGDTSIRRRPMERIVEPLMLMGARIEATAAGVPPLQIEGRKLIGIEYKLPVASAQVKSCLLLAGLLAAGETTVVEPQPTRDHTERMLAASGVPLAIVRRGSNPALPPPARITARPQSSLQLPDMTVPGDLSSAAFHLVAGVLAGRGRVRVEGVGLNPTRVGLLGILNRMSARIEVEETGFQGGEPVGAVVARSGGLQGTHVLAGEVPSAIDELPLVGLLGAFADGETVVAGAGELRHKESDRIAGVVEGLRGLGAEIEATEDGFVVAGSGGLRGGEIDSRGDHRLAMLGAVAGLLSRDGVTVTGIEAAAVSYPGFESDLRSLIR